MDDGCRGLDGPGSLLVLPFALVEVASCDSGKCTGEGEVSLACVGSAVGPTNRGERRLATVRGSTTRADQTTATTALRRPARSGSDRHVGAEPDAGNRERGIPKRLPVCTSRWWTPPDRERS